MQVLLCAEITDYSNFLLKGCIWRMFRFFIIMVCMCIMGSCLFLLFSVLLRLYGRLFSWKLCRGISEAIASHVRTDNVLYCTGDKKQLLKSPLKALQSLQLSSGLLQSKLPGRNTHFSSASARLVFLSCLLCIPVIPSVSEQGNRSNRGKYSSL